MHTRQCRPSLGMDKLVARSCIILEEDEKSDEIETLSPQNENIDLGDSLTPNKDAKKVIAPYVGMLFDSIEEAKRYYEEYGRDNGFSIRVRSSDKTRGRVNEVTGVKLVCSREGHHKKIVVEVAAESIFLKVFARFDVDEIPTQFILKRWMQGANKARVVSTDEITMLDSQSSSEAMRLSHICHISTQLACVASKSEKTYKIVMDTIEELFVKVSDQSRYENDNIPNVSSKQQDDIGITKSSQLLLLDPNISQTKGRKKNEKEKEKITKDISCNGIEREIASLQLEEKKLVAEIKKTAKTGNEASLSFDSAATRILARQLVRLRQQIINLQGSRAQIRGVATHTQAMYANTSISTGMKGATKAMVAMNKQMAPTKQAKVMKEFQKQSAQMDMTIEMLSESIDETLDKDEAEEETEELTNQVLDEIGVDIASQLSSAPKGRIASKKVENVVARPESSDVGDLEKRLASLRRI
ncbi:hypothetical protein HHK36_004832 [Tetracentron sinense]|uniref:Uncharacterized protein n=1 Tax=Tetracentron sinense TaxID=13715 RepID=A0A835DLW9_TETSI|nr:hypothetical protein HHK36_004832 [Tetracentron sinense]